MKMISWQPSAASPASNISLNGKEISRLMTAAVINREFCNLLLADPAVALATGYKGESFHLATEEQELITTIRATSLADFAKQLTIGRNGFSHSHVDHRNVIDHSSHNGHNNGVVRKGYRPA